MTPDKKKITRRRAIGLIGAAVVAGAGGYELVSGRSPVVERHSLHLPRWSADGLKIAFMSDFHLDRESDLGLSERAVKLAIAEKPDLILFGGDILSFQTSLDRGWWRRPFELVADSGIPSFNVLGNHEYSLADREGMIRAIGSAPVRLLRNEAVAWNGVTIAGLDDGLAGRDRHDFLKPGHDKNVIALFHEPDFVERVDERVSLQIAGHSHGGQVCLPGGIAWHTPRGAKKYRKGFYPNAPVPLYVSRGIGTTGIDCRMYCPPEVTILTLNSA